MKIMREKLLFTLTLTCAWVLSIAQIPITIPIATITVDGNTTDWIGITAGVNDPQGDDSSSYTGDDIEAMYLAKDNTNLYIRLDLYDPANPNFGNGPSPYEGRYRFQINSNSSTYSNLDVGLANYYCGQQWALACNGANGTAPVSFQGTSFVGVLNNVIEIKIPLADIANPTDFYQVSSGVDNCCVPDFVTLDSCVIGSLITTIISETIETSKISVYPNPASDVVTLNIDNIYNADLTLNIYNLLGGLVRSELLKQNQQKINVENLSNGIYMLEIKSNQGSEKQKLVIQR